MSKLFERLCGRNQDLKFTVIMRHSAIVASMVPRREWYMYASWWVKKLWPCWKKTSRRR